MALNQNNRSYEVPSGSQSFQNQEIDLNKLQGNLNAYDEEAGYPCSPYPRVWNNITTASGYELLYDTQGLRIIDPIN